MEIIQLENATKIYHIGEVETHALNERQPQHCRRANLRRWSALRVRARRPCCN